MATRKFTAIKVKDSGFIVDNHKHVRFVESVGEATLYEHQVDIDSVLEQYDFKKDDCKLVSVYAYIGSAAPPEVHDALVVAVRTGDNLNPVFEQRLSDEGIHSTLAINNAVEVLKQLFIYEKVQ